MPFWAHGAAGHSQGDVPHVSYLPPTSPLSHTGLSLAFAVVACLDQTGGADREVLAKQ